MTTTPYSRATSGENARGEIIRLLRRFGCEQIGFMDDYEEHAVVLAFRHRGRNMQLRASAKGWAALHVKGTPTNDRQRLKPEVRLQRALAQGQVAINSILRDWVRGQIMAIETGILSFDAVFAPFLLLQDGRTVVDSLKAQGLLDAPAETR